MKPDEIASLKVLLIDDNKFFVGVMIEILETLGISSVTTAADAGQALEYVRRGHFDLVLTEWRMAPMEGKDFVAEVRSATNEKWATIPIIAVTAGADQDSVFEMRDTGVNEIVVKPVSANVLRMRIFSCFERPRDFVRDESYVGPDRRRRVDSAPGAPERRETDLNYRETAGERRGTTDRRVSTDRRDGGKGGPNERG